MSISQPIHSHTTGLELSPDDKTPMADSFGLEFTFLSRQQSFSYKFQHILKRALDILGAGIGLILISPLLLFIAVLIKLTSPGPVFYKSKRLGKSYQPFYMLKFRTMIPEADAERAKLRKQANLEGNLFKLKNDPRITGIGKILRAFSLDEFPQLLNVLRGEMSLVGPRPLPPDESRLFQEPYTLRFQLYPGMTGQWQVMGRSNSSFKELCKLEMDYVLGWSFGRDLKILIKTLPAVLSSHGAY
jgi:lipopolysaccharide/colanic/teichoic acid biosynthesis glycosyltransferase